MAIPPATLHKTGRDAFAKYIALIPDYPALAESLAEVDELIREAHSKLGKASTKLGDQRFYITLSDQRLKLLNAAGLTPKARKQLSGVNAPATPTTQEDDDDEFISS